LQPHVRRHAGAFKSIPNYFTQADLAFRNGLFRESNDPLMSLIADENKNGAETTRFAPQRKFTQQLAGFNLQKWRDMTYQFHEIFD